MVSNAADQNCTANLLKKSSDFHTGRIKIKANVLILLDKVKKLVPELSQAESFPALQAG